MRLPAEGSGPADRVLLLLAGQGAQRPGMAVGLYEVEPVFTAAMNELFAAMGAQGRRIRADWLDSQPRVCLDDASRSQPLLFGVNYALTQTLRSSGVPISRLLGHSIGELAAALLADVFDVAAAGAILRARSVAMAATAPGGMLAVAASVGELTGLLAAGQDGDAENGAVAVAAVNAPRQTILAGPQQAMARVRDRIGRAGLVCRPVRAHQAFHSPVASAAVPALRRAFDRVALRAPGTPIQSTRTGRLVSPAEATSSSFWADQIAAPVLFWPALGAALDGPSALDAPPITVLGAGPARELAALARRQPAVRTGRARVVELAAPGPGESVSPWLTSVEELAARLAGAARGIVPIAS